jgi:hypothetical protein
MKSKPVILKNDKPKELLIKKLIFKNEIQYLEILINETPIQFDTIINNVQDYIQKLIQIKINEDEFIITLLPHEKGISVKINTFKIQPNIEVDGETQIIILREKNETNKVMESKIGFKNPEFPFHYVFEPSDKYDGIFNDFVMSNLPEIRPPTLYTVPSKKTQSMISFRQHIKYIETNTFINFKVEEEGWVFDSFTESEEETEKPNGVKYIPAAFWTYHPRCLRIEHLLQFQ